MAEIDVSSYKQPALPSSLDMVGKLQQLQQGEQAIRSNELGITKQQLDLANTRFNNIIREVNSLPPEATTQDYFKLGQNAVNQGIWTPENYGEFVKTIPTDPKQLSQFKQTFLAKALHAQEAINWHYGQSQDIDNGQTVIPGVRSNRPGFAGQPQGGFIPQSAPIQKQVPPTAPGVLPSGQPAYVGPQAPQLAPGTVSQPGPLPVGPITSPAIRGPSANFGGNVLGAVVEPPTPAQSVTDRFPNVPRGPATGPTPLFEEGKKQFVEDQNLATGKLTAIKPALQALPLIKGLTTGIGTDTYNRALAAGYNLGLLPQGMTDRVAAYQELSKKLANYVSSNPVGQRSDAAQTLAEASSPSPKAQINPALIKLTKDAIGLDRVQALRALSFNDPDYSKYGNHRAAFPARIDERAVTLDLMDPKERQDLLDEMEKKQNTSEGKKFKNTLRLIKDTKLFDY